MRFVTFANFNGINSPTWPVILVNTELGGDANNQLFQVEQAGSSTALRVETCLKYFTLSSDTQGPHSMLKTARQLKTLNHLIFNLFPQGTHRLYAIRSYNCAVLEICMVTKCYSRNVVVKETTNMVTKKERVRKDLIKEMTLS